MVFFFYLLEYRLKLAILGQEFDINKLIITILGGGGEKYIIDNDNATLTLCLFSYNVPMSFVLRFSRSALCSIKTWS